MIFKKYYNKNECLSIADWIPSGLLTYRNQFIIFFQEKGFYLILVIDTFWQQAFEKLIQTMKVELREIKIT